MSRFNVDVDLPLIGMRAKRLIKATRLLEVREWFEDDLSLDGELNLTLVSYHHSGDEEGSNFGMPIIAFLRTCVNMLSST